MRVVENSGERSLEIDEVKKIFKKNCEMESHIRAEVKDIDLAVILLEINDRLYRQERRIIEVERMVTRIWMRDAGL